MKLYRITYRGNEYATWAQSPRKAISNVRYRNNLRFAPMDDFTATEVSADAYCRNKASAFHA